MHPYPSLTDLLVDIAEVFQDVIHAVLLQGGTAEGISQAVDLYTVQLIHVKLNVAAAGLQNSCDIEQV